MTAGRSNGVSSIVIHLVLFVAVAAFAATAAEPVNWVGGGWDDRGAPKGRLLTDNSGWWGRSVFTGVTYRYEVAPTAPNDWIKDGKESVGNRRLVDGKVAGSWHVPVGITGGCPIVAVFDFKRPCTFGEVDFMSSRTTNAVASVLFSVDCTNWTSAVSASATSAVTRLFIDAPAKGRFMKVSYKSASGNLTYLDEILAWGEGEVSLEYPEAIAPIPAGEALRFTERRDGGIEIVPLSWPTLATAKKVESERVKIETARPILVARNGTATRYFVVRNAGAENATVALTPPDFGDSAISTELLIGGVVRSERPKVKLTEWELLLLMTTDVATAEGGGDTNRLEVLPFFTVSQVPPANFARKYLANAAQVVGFPTAVPLAPGEGFVGMIRIAGCDASLGLRESAVRAGGASLPLVVNVRDVVLPLPPIWIHTYNPFTSQFPFESESRIETDVRRLAELGVSSCYGFPMPRSKPARLKALAPHTIFATSGGCPARLYGDTHHGKWEHFDATNREAIAKGAHATVRKARELGLKPEEYCAFLPDEPARRNAALIGEMAAIMKEAEPTLQIYMNPSFWEGKGFPPEKEILNHLKPYYNELIDISCPVRNLVRPTNALTKELWTAKRRVNAQYIHPAARAGRSIAWLSFETGMNGFAYYCYYAPRGNSWDIRTWGSLDYRYQMVFPLENDVAVTPIYETMREAWEDYRILSALRDAGKTELLAELLAVYEGATNYSDSENVPNRANFRSLRDKALSAFGGCD